VVLRTRPQTWSHTDSEGIPMRTLLSHSLNLCATSITPPQNSAQRAPTLWPAPACSRKSGAKHTRPFSASVGIPGLACASAHANLMAVLSSSRPLPTLDRVPLPAHARGGFATTLAHTSELPDDREGVHGDLYVLPACMRCVQTTILKCTRCCSVRQDVLAGHTR
jgi:hypothetical protein